MILLFMQKYIKKMYLGLSQYKNKAVFLVYSV